MERLGNFPKVMARKGWSWDNESRKSSTEDNKGPGESKLRGWLCYYLVS